MRTYFAFTDPSGGSSDSFTLAVSYLSRVQQRAVLAGFWERRPPFSPDTIVEEFAAILRDYRVAVVTGDKYAAAWVVERFAHHGIRYVPSERTKSEIFADFVALVNSGRVRMPGNKRLRVQFESLERRMSRSGKELIDHPVGSHDDVANSVAGALTLVACKQVIKRPWIEVLDVGLPGGERLWQRM